MRLESHPITEPLGFSELQPTVVTQDEHQQPLRWQMCYVGVSRAEKGRAGDGEARRVTGRGEAYLEMCISCMYQLSTVSPACVI